VVLSVVQFLFVVRYDVLRWYVVRVVQVVQVVQVVRMAGGASGASAEPDDVNRATDAHQ